MHVHIYQLSTQWAAKSWRQVASLQLEGDGRTIRTHDHAEILDIKGSCVEVRRRRIDIVTRAIVVVKGICCLKDKRTWSKVENNASLIVCGSTSWADGYCIQHRGSTCYRQRYAERAIRIGWCTGQRGLAIVVCICCRHVDRVAGRRRPGNGHRRTTDT